ncbi:MAG TPA: porin family protein [Cytophagaceae bacterium]
MKKLLFTTLAILTILNLSSAQEQMLDASSDVPEAVNKIGRGFAFEIGLNRLNNAPEDLEIKTLRSKAVNFYYLYNIKLVGKKLTLSPGFGVGLENYNFEKDLLFQVNNKSMVPVVDTFSNRNYEKSKIALTYLDIPLELRFQTSDKDSKAFKIAVGAKAGLLVKASGKVKYEQDGIDFKEKVAHSFFLNNFRYGLTGRIGYGHIQAFAYYSLSELFEKDKWPQGYGDVTPFIIGIALTTF